MLRDSVAFFSLILAQVGTVTVEPIALTSLFESLDSFIMTVQHLAKTVGLPLLFIIFITKGMLIGKIFPTSVFLPGYVILVNASVQFAAIIAVVTGIGYVIGQFVVFYGSRRYGRSFVTQLPYADIDPDSPQFTRLDDWFRRWGGLSIFGTNWVPWIRGLVTIPAATSSYPTLRYLFYTTTSTILYHLVYVGLALAGIELVT